MGNIKFSIKDSFQSISKGKMVWFSVPFLLFILTGGILLLFINRGDIVLSINSFSSLSLDKFFLFITDIGLGSVVATIGVLLVFYKIRWSLFVLADLALVGIFTNLLKKQIFNSYMRPFHYLMYDDFSRFIHDAPLIYFSSFPSGHTMTIFAFCSILAFLLRKKTVSLLLFILALVVGISRVYLLQHFFIDIYVGAFMGLACSLLTIFLLNRFLSEKKFPKLNKSLISLVVRKS